MSVPTIQVGPTGHGRDARLSRRFGRDEWKLPGIRSVAMVDDARPTSGIRKPLLGTLALKAGWINAAQIMEAISDQAQDFMEGRHHRLIGEVLMVRGHLTSGQVQDLLRMQEAAGLLPRVEDEAKPARAPDAHGPSIFGKYLLVRKLGEGSTGWVYEAIDSTAGDKVALKRFARRPGATPEELARDHAFFLRETKTCSQLPSHPNLVKLRDSGVIEDQCYIAMEYVEGMDMADWLTLEGVSLHQRLSLLRDAAHAVHHTHEHGIIHRDLKPRNILVDRDHRPHIADFGLAKLLKSTGSESVTVSGMLAGTPAYMSPEQAQSKKSVDARTDIYSLGVMLYEIITGRTPFGEKATIMTLVRLVTEPPPPPSRVVAEAGRPPVDPVLERICLKALSADPGHRHPTARALADDLNAWLDR